MQVEGRVVPLPDDDLDTLRQRLREACSPTDVTDLAEPQHDPSAALARLVDVRDRRCSGPGCGSTRTHRDHAEPWPAGPTAAWNLQRLSARCHRAKHAGWQVDRHDDGSTTWHSPLGRTYRRASPRARPPQVDLHAPSPPRRPPSVPTRFLDEVDLRIRPRPPDPPRRTPPDVPLLVPDDPPPF